MHAEPVSHSQARAILRGRLRSPSAAPRHPRRTYFRRERAEGKKSLEALRCLKRRISDVIYRNLVADEERAAGTDLEVAPRRALRAVSRIQRDRRLPYIDTSDQPPRTRTSNATPDITTRAGPTRQRPCTDRLLNRREAKGSTLSGALSSGAFRTRNAQRRARPESGPPHNGTASRRKRIRLWDDSPSRCRWGRGAEGGSSDGDGRHSGIPTPEAMDAQEGARWPSWPGPAWPQQPSESVRRN